MSRPSRTTNIFPTPPTPPSLLGYYRQLSPNAGIHVSPLQLGAMSIGDQHGSFLGDMNKEQSFGLLDAYYDAGGNFIDTASNYQNETSEEFIGEWAEQRGIRDQLVIATKYTHHYKLHDTSVKIQANHIGNNVKSMHMSVEASLKKLRTSYIDILYVHWWDFETSVKEVMDGLHKLVMQGKVLYLGISDTPAWIVSKANQYAEDHGKSPFVIYQGAWNVMSRSFERDIIPMARSLGLALAPWDVIGGGRLRTTAEEERRRQSGEKGRAFSAHSGELDLVGWERTPAEKAMVAALEKVAQDVGTEHITAVAIAYVMQKTTHVFPIVGGRKIEHLKANIEALGIALTPEQIEYLESVVPFDVGFPHAMIGDGNEIPVLMTPAAHFKKLRVVSPLRPEKV
ncbi:Aldo/keto reductase [Schizopora paradoxa]|uniref:Aldo/keto reductase n=1 Tax=Schizopora paradoxa TaxID=27342 RepID=A0A0H2R9F8_9AGAM|nr:Aldo/keto reductase [Schizopora paradoxa]